MSFWNGAWPDFLEFIRSIRADTVAAQAFMPAALAGTKLRKKSKPVRGGFSVFIALVDVLATFLSAAATSAISTFAYGEPHTSIDPQFWMCSLVGAFFVAVSAFRNDYAVGHYLTNDDQLRRSLTPWCTAFAITLGIASLAAPATDHRLLPPTSFFVIGLAGVGLARQCLTHGIRARAAEGNVIARRIFLLGFESELEAFARTWEPYRFGMHIVAASVLCGPESLNQDLALARAYARILAPDDVFILVPWSDQVTIEAAIDAFLGVPAAIHLGPEKILDRFVDARITKVGPVTCINLVDHPLSRSALFIKRLFDVAIASLALTILSPLFLIVAAAIRLDSPGPIIFRQSRYGFNQQPFRIFKFRSMTTCEDNSKLVQVTSRSDARVTRVGAFLRRHNIDELPQLLNVIRGDMSLVGPRPMAVVHDQMFERSISLYARRHNVKPGITGWAQINGCRGGLSEDKIRARIQHDLYYIDHWSLWLDLGILWRTLMSKQAYMDAF